MSGDYTAREMRLISERDAALSQAEALEKAITESIRRLDAMLRIIDYGSGAMGVEMVCRHLAFVAGIKRERQL